ncbi:MAG: hypothetical protein L7S44_01990 [Flavobacteriaceae bacterium]|nr:hypothetical protein [Flavobacteriaceae bacterium]
MKKIVFTLCLLLISNLGFSQQLNNIQRGQRGYAPMPKYNNSAYVSTLDIYKELSKILPKCQLEFNLDDFEMQIIKGLLIEKMENYNTIVENEDYTRDVRQSKLKANEFQYIKSLSSILDSEEIARYIEMDFENDRDDKKKKRNKKKNKKTKKS